MFTNKQNKEVSEFKFSLMLAFCSASFSCEVKKMLLSMRHIKAHLEHFTQFFLKNHISVHDPHHV